METRSIRSYVLRAGRITPAQKSGLLTLKSKYTADLGSLGQVERLFDCVGSIHLEIGFGNSDNLIASASARPNTNYLGCEVHPPGIAQALIAIERLRLTNVKVFDQDVYSLLPAMKDNSLDGVDMFFPDPWPKKKHVKRRLVQAEFLKLLGKKLKRRGIFRFATDNMSYAMDVVALVRDMEGWRNLAGDALWSPRPVQRIVTRFEAKARKELRRIFEISIFYLP